MVHAAVDSVSYPTIRGGSHAKSNMYELTPIVVVAFLARSCFTSNGMHIPSKTWVLILTLYLISSALYLVENILEKYIIYYNKTFA